MKARTYLALFLSTFIWGGSFVFSKAIFAAEPAMTTPLLLTLRLVVGTAVFLPILALMRKLQPIARQDLKWFLLLASMEPFLYGLCETGALRYLDSTIVSTAVATIPLCTILLFWLFFRRPMGWGTIVGIVLSLGGVLALIYNNGLGGTSSGEGQLLSGFLLLVGTLVTSVIYLTVLERIVNHYDPLTIIGYQNAIGLLYYLPVVLLTCRANLAQLSYSPQMILYVSVLGIFASTLAYIFYAHGMQAKGIASVAFLNASPVFTLAIALLMGQEDISWLKAGGIALVLVGLVVSNYQRPKTEAPATSPAKGEESR